MKVTQLYLILAMVVLSGCNTNSTNNTEQAVTIPVTQVIPLSEQQEYRVIREFTGTVQASDQASLGFELGGKINSVLISVGDTVNKGDPLLSIDTALLETERSQLAAQKQEVIAQLKLTEANLKRQRALKARGFSADAEIDSLTSQRRVLLANNERINASLSALELRITKSTLYAPFAGVIAERNAALGDVVGTGQAVVSLLSTKAQEAHIGLPNIAIRSLENNSDLQIRVGDTHFPATVSRHAAQIEAQSRTQLVRFTLPNDAGLLNGQLAYLQLEEHNPSSGYWIPLSALTDGIRGTWNVFIVNEQNIVERRTVNVVHSNTNSAYINGAITSGESLVTNGLHKLVPGQEVSTQEPL